MGKVKALRGVVPPWGSALRSGFAPLPPGSRLDTKVAQERPKPGPKFALYENIRGEIEMLTSMGKVKLLRGVVPPWGSALRSGFALLPQPS